MSGGCRIVFMGTPDFAVPSLAALISSDHSVVAAVSSPDKPAGRGLQDKVSPVKQYAINRNIPVLQPENLKDPLFLAQLRSFGADIFVVVAFRKLPREVWSMPRLGTFNLHASLLPDYRGAAPIQRAIMNGERMTGLTTFLIDEQIDTGKVILRQEIEIPDDADAGYMHDIMMEAGADMVLKTAGLICRDEVIPIPQEQLSSQGQQLHTAPKISKDDCLINWNRSTVEIHNQIRALSPYPGAFTHLGTGPQLPGKAFKIFKSRISEGGETAVPGTIHTNLKDSLCIRCTDGYIQCLEVQVEGKRRMETAGFLKGFRDIESCKAC